MTRTPPCPRLSRTERVGRRGTSHRWQYHGHEILADGVQRVVSLAATLEQSILVRIDQHLRRHLRSLAINLATRFNQVFLRDRIFAMQRGRLELMVVGDGRREMNIASRRFFAHKFLDVDTALTCHRSRIIIDPGLHVIGYNS